MSLAMYCFDCDDTIYLATNYGNGVITYSLAEHNYNTDGLNYIIGFTFCPFVGSLKPQESLRQYLAKSLSKNATGWLDLG
jgi:hypothetical protein